MWGSGPGHLSPERICCPGMVLSPILQHGEPKARQVLVLVWWGGTHCAPHCPSCLQESRRTPRHLFYPLFYSFSFGCIRFSPWCHEASMHTLQATQQGGSGGEKKKHQFLENENWNFSFPTWTSLVTWSIYKTKHKMCFSLLTTTAAHVSSDLFQALVLIWGKSQLCVGVSGMIQQRNMHDWKCTLAVENRNVIYHFQTSSWKSPVSCLPKQKARLCSVLWWAAPVTRSALQRALSKKHHTTAWKHCLYVLYYFHWTASNFSTAKKWDKQFDGHIHHS